MAQTLSQVPEVGEAIKKVQEAGALTDAAAAEPLLGLLGQLGRAWRLLPATASTRIVNTRVLS